MNLKEAEQLAVDLMKQFGVFQKGWRFRFDSARKRFGLCSYRDQTISLSRVLVELNDRQHVEDTIRHEIAHALTGARAGHGRRWKLQAVACGAKPERCYSSNQVIGVKDKYEGLCSDCGERIGYMRRPSKRMLRSGYHSPCRRKRNRGKLVWSLQGAPLTGSLLDPRAALSRFARRWMQPKPNPATAKPVQFELFP